jgi:ATP-binding cassette subfamily B (MDR/TAP) protein 1
MHVKKPSRASFTPFVGFFQLLFYSNPTWLDKLLVAVGCIAAIAAGVPFPLIGIVFGQLVDKINDATCNNIQGTGAANSGEQSSINSKILLLVYIAIGSFACIYIHLVCWNVASQRLAQRGTCCDKTWPSSTTSNQGRYPLDSMATSKQLRVALGRRSALL